MPQSSKHSAEQSAADGGVCELVDAGLRGAEDENRAIVGFRQLAGEWFRLGKVADARALVAELIRWCETNNAQSEVLDALRGDMSAIESHIAKADLARDSSAGQPEEKPRQKQTRAKRESEDSRASIGERVLLWAAALAIIIAALWHASVDTYPTVEGGSPGTTTVAPKPAPSKTPPATPKVAPKPAEKETHAPAPVAPKIALPESLLEAFVFALTEREMYVSASGGVNIRAAADGKSEVVGKISQFADVTGVGKPQNGWQRVRAASAEGYIRADLLAAGDGKTARCEAGVERPGNGEVFVQQEFGRHEIEINNGDRDAFVKFKNTAEDTVLSFYVHSGQSAAVDNAPDGTYFFFYSSGERFSVVCGKFMDDAQYEKDPSPKDMDAPPDQITILQYSLRPRVLGNFRPREISEEEFLR